MFTNLEKLPSLELIESNKELSIKEKSKVKIHRIASISYADYEDWEEGMYNNIMDKPFSKSLIIKPKTGYPFYTKNYLGDFKCSNCVNYLHKTQFCIHKEVHVISDDVACINYITSLTT